MKKNCSFVIVVTVSLMLVFSACKCHLGDQPICSHAPEQKAVSYAKDGFYTQLEDGRLWVFKNDSKELAEFKSKGELAKHVTRPGAGPGGITLRAPDSETIDRYLAAN
jgi:hypothetical protein